MNRTVKVAPVLGATEDATIKTFHYPDFESLKAHILAFVSAYNFAKHLKALRWKRHSKPSATPGPPRQTSSSSTRVTSSRDQTPSALLRRVAAQASTDQGFQANAVASSLVMRSEWGILVRNATSRRTRVDQRASSSRDCPAHPHLPATSKPLAGEPDTSRAYERVAEGDGRLALGLVDGRFQASPGCPQMPPEPSSAGRL